MALIFTVTYNKNDGSGTTLYCEDSSKNVLDGITTVGANWGETPQNWSRTGYVFLYWNTAADGSGTSIEPGNIFSGSSATVYAIWQAEASDAVIISLGETEIASMNATGTKTLATQGTYVANDITVEYNKPTPSLQAKTGISPSTSSQTITPDSGYDGLSSVQINAMTTMTLPTSTSSSSLGTQRAAITPSTSTAYLNIPIGYNSTRRYYTLNAMTSGSATTPAETVNVYPNISVSSSGLITASVALGKSITPTVVPGYVATGTSGNISIVGSGTSQLTTQAATTYTPTTTNQTIASGKYLTGAQTILGDQNLTAENIKKDVSIFGVTGTYEGSGGSGGGTVMVTLTIGSMSSLPAGTVYYIDENGDYQSEELTIDENYNFVWSGTVPENSLITWMAGATTPLVMGNPYPAPTNATVKDNPSIAVGRPTAYVYSALYQANSAS